MLSYKRKSTVRGAFSFRFSKLRNFYQSYDGVTCYNKTEVIAMDYYEHIQKALDYIEENLKNDMDNAILADVAGYSEYHFLRIFRETVRLTPADYIRKRRITEIVRSMTYDSRPISEIAFEYGFNSKENFVRAFKREHHILPTDFRTAQNSLKLYDRLTFRETTQSPSVSVVELDSFRIVAYKSDEDNPPHYWNKYNTQGYSKILSGGAVVEDFGVCKWNNSANKLDYYIGIRETDARGDVSGTDVLDISGGRYAVFETPSADLFGFVDTVQRTWEYIRTWLSENGYRRTGGFELESYVENSRKFSEKIYIPITGEGENNEKA